MRPQLFQPAYVWRRTHHYHKTVHLAETRVIFRLCFSLFLSYSVFPPLSLLQLKTQTGFWSVIRRSWPPTSGWGACPEPSRSTESTETPWPPPRPSPSCCWWLRRRSKLFVLLVKQQIRLYLDEFSLQSQQILCVCLIYDVLLITHLQVAEVGEFEASKEKLLDYARRCYKTMDDPTHAKVQTMKKTHKLLPISYRFRNWTTGAAGIDTEHWRLLFPVLHISTFIFSRCKKRKNEEIRLI